MKHRYLAAIIAPLLLISQQITAIAATPSASISNISASKQLVQPMGLLKVTWNFSAENLTLDEAKKMEVTLTPESGAPCQPQCPFGIAKFTSGYLSGGLWTSNIYIPASTIQTDYYVNISLPGVASAKSQNTVKISSEPSPLDTVRVVPTFTGTGWPPSIGPITRTLSGFTFKVLNFNTDYTWSYSAVNAFTSLDGEGNFIVRGLSAGIESEVTIQTRSATGVLSTAKFKERSLNRPPVQFELKPLASKKTSFEFTLTELEPFSGANYRFEASNGLGVSSTTTAGQTKYVLEGISESSTVAIEVFTSRYKGEDGYGLIIGSSLPKPAPVVIATPTPTPTPSATPTASASPTPTPSPSVTATPSPTTKAKKTITCVKGKITQKITNFNPKCPKGYKKK
jgi:hypothetical protein